METAQEKVRLDRWLNAARIFRTRSRSAVACRQGRVRVNGRAAKPGREVGAGDRLEIRHRDWTRILVVEGVRPKPVARALARELYSDLTPARPRQSWLERLLSLPAGSREKGSGRPTKRERRRLQRWRRDHSKEDSTA